LQRTTASVPLLPGCDKVIGYYKGGNMKYTAIYKMMGIIGLLLLGASLFAQESKSRQDILNIINNAPRKIMVDDPKLVGSVFNKDMQYFTSMLSSSDVPVIYDLVLDKTINYDMRERLANTAALLNPDKEQIDRVIDYLIKTLPGFEVPERKENILAPLIQSIPLLYKKAQDDKVLAPFRKLYEDSSCKRTCKSIIISTLRETKAEQNFAFYLKIIHDPNGTDSHRDMAGLGVAGMGSLESIPYLGEMVADYLFATDKPAGISPYNDSAMAALRDLGKKHYEANEAIQEIITKACTLDTDKYGPRMKNPTIVARLFSILQQNGGEGNRKYLENLLDKGCKYPNAKQYATQALRNMPATP
jgi:hypothetical protein